MIHIAAARASRAAACAAAAACSTCLLLRLQLTAVLELGNGVSLDNRVDWQGRGWEVLRVVVCLRWEH